MFIWVCTLELETWWDLLIHSLVRVPACFSSSPVDQSGNRKLFRVHLVLCPVNTVHKVRLELENLSAYLNSHIGTWDRTAMLIWTIHCVQLAADEFWYVVGPEDTRLALGNLLATRLLSNLVWDGCSGYDVLVFLAIMHVGIYRKSGLISWPRHRYQHHPLFT